MPVIVVCFNHLYPIHSFFFNDTATTEIYTLSLHDALPISPCHRSVPFSPGLSRVNGRGSSSSGPRHTTSQPTASWPSRYTVAAIGSRSPTTALAGYRPQATTGNTSSIGMRPGPPVICVIAAYVSDIDAGSQDGRGP